jgi:hypothetical protein
MCRAGLQGAAGREEATESHWLLLCDEVDLVRRGGGILFRRVRWRDQLLSRKVGVVTAMMQKVSRKTAQFRWDYDADFLPQFYYDFYTHKQEWNASLRHKDRCVTKSSSSVMESASPRNSTFPQI